MIFVNITEYYRKVNLHIDITVQDEIQLRHCCDIEHRQESKITILLSAGLRILDCPVPESTSNAYRVCVGSVRLQDSTAMGTVIGFDQKKGVWISVEPKSTMTLKGVARCIVDFELIFDDLQVWLRHISLNLNAGKVMKAFFTFSGQILKKTFISLQAFRFKVKRLNQTCTSSKSTMQLTTTLCSASAIFIEKKWVENRSWPKKHASSACRAESAADHPGNRAANA